MGAYRSGSVRRAIIIRKPAGAAWEAIKEIADLDWVAGVKSARYITEQRNGAGAGREIHFDDGRVVTEYVVGWRQGRYLSYIATDGLGVGAYHATISIHRRYFDECYVTWQSFFNDTEMDWERWKDFRITLAAFYTVSLRRLKRKLEEETAPA